MKRYVVVVVAATLVAMALLAVRSTAEREPGPVWQVVPQSHGPSIDTQPTGARQQSQGRSREVVFEKGRRLSERLEPSDEELEVVLLGAGPFAAGGDEDPFRELEFHTRRADAVVVVRAVEARAQLTPAEDWINSTIDFQIEEVLKSTDGRASLAAGQVLSFGIRGGEISVNGRRIVARPSWSDIPRTNGRYLYFLFWDRGQYKPFPNTQQFEVTTESIRRLQRDARWTIDRDGMKPEVAFDAIRLAAKLPPLQ